MKHAHGWLNSGIIFDYTANTVKSHTDLFVQSHVSQMEKQIDSQKIQDWEKETDTRKDWKEIKKV